MCDAPDIFNQEEIHAKRPHQCCECGGRIGIGEKYERTKGLWDGLWDTFATCLACCNVRAIIESEKNTFDCLAVGGMRDFWEIILECPRDVLSHALLEEVQKHKDSRFWDETPDSMADYVRFRRTHGYTGHETLKGLMKWHDTLCSPKKFKNWQRENIESLKSAQQSFNYYLKNKDSADVWQRDYCRKKLEHPAC